MKNKNILITVFTSLFCLFFATSVFSAEPANPFNVNIKITEPTTPKTISPFIWGAGVGGMQTPTAAAVYSKFSKENIKALGIKMLRYPGGCDADLFNYKNSSYSYNLFGGPQKTESIGLSIDEFLKLTTETNTEPLYVLNVQQKAGAPDPCAWYTNNPGSVEDVKDIVQKYTIDRRNSGGKYIKFYEMGNESWGDYKYTDYPFSRSLSDYAATAVTYAKAMKLLDPTIKISLQGYPSTGNNQAINGTAQATGDAIPWNNKVKELMGLTCNGVPCFDFVTDHPYVNAGYNKILGGSSPSNFPGMSSYFPLINYKAVFDVAKTSYPSKDLDITEWNVKCWGGDPYAGVTTPPYKVNVANPLFVSSLSGWSYSQSASGSGETVWDSGALNGGNPSAKLILSKAEGKSLSIGYNNQISQEMNVASSSGVKVYVSVYSSSPQNVSVTLEQANESLDPANGNSQEKGKLLAEKQLNEVSPNKWQTVMIDFINGPRTSSLKISLKNSRKPNSFSNSDPEIVSYFDDIKVIQSGPYGFAVSSRNTVESGMFVAESMMLMAKSNVHKSIYHYMADTAQCGLMNGALPSPEGQGFSFSSAMAGGNLLDVSSDTPNKRIEKDPTCNNLSCFSISADLPYLNTYASLSTDKKVHVFLVNHHETNTAAASVNLSSFSKVTSGSVINKKNLISTGGYTQIRFTESSETLTLPDNKIISVSVPPVSMVRLEVVITPPPSDINKDDKVDISDLSTMVAAYDTKPYTIFDYNNLSENYQSLSNYAYGLPSDIPVIGNWAGGKRDFPAVVRGPLWLQKNSFITSFADKTVNTNFTTTDKVNYLACDWTGTGQKTPVIFSNGIWRVRGTNSDGDSTLTFAFGNPGDIPICGNWKGRADNKQSPGVYRNGVWYLSENIINPSVSAPQNIIAPISYNFGQPGDLPLIGKWTSGKIDLPAVYRPNNSTFYLKYSHDSGFANTSFVFGNPGDKPIVGDFAGTGKSSVGIVRNGFWYFKDL